MHNGVNYMKLAFIKQMFKCTQPMWLNHLCHCSESAT